MLLTDDHDGVQKSVAKLRVDMPNAKYVTFVKKGHFTLGGLGGEAFPELWAEIVG